MANMFALILAIATLVTGIIWCVDKVKLAPARRARREQAQIQAGGQLDETALSKVAKPQGWIETAVSVFPVLLVVFVVRSFIVEPFQIPSGSMMPTLLVGDFILVEKFAYGIKDPITQTTLIETGHPQRGDVVVFKFPKNPKEDYIKRAIGLPGDRITYDPLAKTLTVFPACRDDNHCKSALPITYSDVRDADFIETFGGNGGSETSSNFYQRPPGQTIPGGLRLAEREETLGEVTHRILLIPEALGQTNSYYHQSGQPQASWIVPQGMYFMMGDNRDNSYDSRYWGFVPEKNLVGRAFAIWMSFEKQPGEWPTGIRFSRIGGIH
ncbi:S26 family signal peptidase [Erwinia sp. OLTSP20]|uniref:signal peptidase I n=1 Tax=unclassified Erwinia TaxID=2622719 RepID=UPI000C18CA8B|nr:MULTISPECIES: signal peptidase I [unclassified Erwinia]PIJ52339.1 S26 family signal peptidase [Erwinia sp. OAMSP11]PIJ73548.1 S26 family signal peptidase [Erwinia sp. OLSSP12]PIJ85365.1 S26 family signal peptidase [Erwinia sp. OLCASP19]PIJ87607.1 S26 family signal peptidase [Erwinia sp. OLMTSP26]PIJ89114.1 S26 family signal peptidase [Erwinia sp. OLMDSP33]